MEILRTVILLMLGIGVVIFVVTPLFLEKSLIYYPSRSMKSTPADWGLQYEDVYFHVADGTRLNGWYVPFYNPHELPRENNHPQTPQEPRLVTLWLHANAHNISEAYDGEMMVLIQRYLKTDLFIFDYGGYGKSEGSVSESGTYSDARAALAYLVQRGTSSEYILLFGHSLGSAVAVQLAIEQVVKGVVLWSPFTSVAAMARYHYPILGHLYTTPFWLPGIKYDSYSKIKQVRSPLLVIHGEDDKVVPLWMARELYNEADAEKEMVVLRGADHNMLSDWKEMLGAIDSFVRKLKEK